MYHTLPTPVSVTLALLIGLVIALVIALLTRTLIRPTLLPLVEADPEIVDLEARLAGYGLAVNCIHPIAYRDATGNFCCGCGDLIDKPVPCCTVESQHLCQTVIPQGACGEGLTHAQAASLHGGL